MLRNKGRSLLVTGLVRLLEWSGALGLLPGVVSAQLIPDTTLGAESSIVAPLSPTIDVIGSGAPRGINLFHSFREFNVGAGRGAYFLVPNTVIQSVFARVTGTSRSDVSGILGVRNFIGGAYLPSNANLFLINPNGIIFGPDARLDIGGSFVATTANSIQFGDRGIFDATNPKVPSSLLTINPSAFLFNQVVAQPIINQSRAANLSVPSFIDGLRVPDGKSLLLLGGDIILKGGVLRAVGGRIEIGGIKDSGSVGLTVNGNTLDLTFPNNVTLADVSLRAEASGNSSSIDTSGIANTTYPTGGEIQTNSTNLIIANGSTISSNNFGNQDGKDILLRSSQLELSGQSIISATTGGNGNGGSIKIDTTRLQIQNASILTGNIGTGNGGNIEIDADQLQMQNTFISTGNIGGTGRNGRIAVRANKSINLQSSVFSSLSLRQGGRTNIERSGGIVIETDDLDMQGSNIFVNTLLGGDDTGDINIQAKTIRLSESALSTSSAGFGAGGNIDIRTGSLSLNQGSRITTRTFDFSTVDFSLFSGTLPPENIAVLIALRDSAPPGSLGQANAGDLSITATNLVEVIGTSLNRNVRSELLTGTFGAGKGGDLSITTANLRISDGGAVNASSEGSGSGGNIIVNADNAINISGLSSDRAFASFLGSGATNIGSAGSVVITSRTLSVRDGAFISTQTFGQGQGGNLTVSATESMNISGTGTFANGRISQSSLVAATSGAGASGNIHILNTGRLIVRDGALVSASTFSSGHGGNIEVNADTIELAGTTLDGQIRSAIESTVSTEASGNGGLLTVQASKLYIRNGARISAGTNGRGSAGSLRVIAADAVEVIGTSSDNRLRSNLNARVELGASGNGGNLSIETQRLSVGDGAGISVATSGQGNAGALNILAGNFVKVFGTSTNGQFSSELSASAEAGSTGTGGNLNIRTGEISIWNGGRIISRSEGEGSAGSIVINTQGRLQVNNGTISTSSTQAGGGSIEVTAKGIFLRGNSDIRTDTAKGEGNSGNITLTAGSIIAFNDSDILAFAEKGRGGNITLNTPAFFGQNYRPGSPPPFEGNNRVDINASGTISGVITLPDTTFIQNSLAQLSQTIIDTNSLLANSCIARREQSTGSFFMTGSGGLPERPSEVQTSAFPTGEVHSVEDQVNEVFGGDREGLIASSTSSFSSIHAWKIGDPIIEPQGVYQLPNGEFVLSHECR